MKRTFIYIIAGLATLTACHKKHLSYKTGIVDEPMYITDRKVEQFRENSGISTTNNNQAGGPGSGYSYASYGSRQEVLNTMAKVQRSADSVNQTANMRSYNLSDTLSENTQK